MMHDLRFAVRQLWKAPGFTIAAVLVLTLGIGANTAIFSLVHTMLFAPPGYERPNELVQIFSQDTKNPKSYRAFSYPILNDIREQNTVFSGVAGYNVGMVGIGEKNNTRRTFASVVTANYLNVLGVAPVIGRGFTVEEEQPGRTASVALVSYGYWTRRERDNSILGSQILINGRSYTIVGVLPKTFTGTLAVLSPEVWLPLSAMEFIASNPTNDPSQNVANRASQQLLIMARLKPGVTTSNAEAALKTLATNIERAYPVEQKDQTFVTAPLSRFSISDDPPDDSQMGAMAPMLRGMASVVLFVACLNLANMLLARGTARRKEIAIRLAVGGSRWRIVRQLLTEGFVLALLGGVGGLVLGLWSSDLLIGSMRRFMPFEIVWSTGANPAILAATFGFCLLGTLMFALGPALRISRSAVITDLKEHAGEDIIRRRWKLLPRNPLVVVHLAFSLALLTSAALFVRGANKAASVDSGLKPGASYLLEVDASLAGYEPKRAQELYQNLNARLAALPDVEQVSISATVPFGIVSSDKNVQRAGVNPGAEARPSTAAEGLAFKAAWNSVGANYFSTVGLPVLRGRAFTEAEATQPGPSVAIIDKPLAKKLWPNGDAIGQRVQYAAENTPSGQRGGAAAGGTGAALSKEEKQDETIEIIGIVPVTRHDLFASEEPDGSIYLPFARGFQSDVSFFVRFRSLAPGTEAATADLLRRAVREVDPSLPVISLQTFAQFLDSNLDLWLVRAGAALFSVFGGLALGLAVVGLYGVKAYSVARRTREIGIRMALGAQRGMVLRLIMREGSVMLLCGLAL